MAPIELLSLIKSSKSCSLSFDKSSSDYIGDENLDGVKEVLATVETSNFYTYRDEGKSCYIYTYFQIGEYYACILSYSYYDNIEEDMSDPTPARIFLAEKKDTVNYSFERKKPA